MSFFPNSNNLLTTGGSFISNNRNGPSVLDKLAEAAADSALDNAPARKDSSRCHPDTRVNVLEELETWVHGVADQSTPMFWLHGGAGAGKSAVMQTLAERLRAQFSIFVAGFFFSRTDARRNHAAGLVPAFAYRLVQHFPSLEGLFDTIISQDPLIFTSSVPNQFRQLLFDPLRRLAENETLTTLSKFPCVFLIDGLDECIDKAEQREIIQSIAVFYHHEHRLPVKFLIASRIEVEISTAFRVHAAQQGILESTSLSDDIDADRDIRHFITAELERLRKEHPFPSMVPPDWPSEDQISSLVHKSSSHFIYASTAMGYIFAASETPVRALEVVLGLERSLTEGPWAELDALYRHIIESSAHRDKVLEIICFCTFSNRVPTIWVLSYALGCSYDDIYIYLADMSPLINIVRDHPNDDAPLKRSVRLLHASLVDFLHDQQRSGFLYIDEGVRIAKATRQCYAVMSSIIKDQNHLRTFYRGASLAYYCSALVRSIQAAIMKTGGVCGPVYDIVRQHSIHVFHDLSYCCRLGLPYAEDIVTTIEEVNFPDSKKLLTQYLDDYAEIHEPNILDRIGLIGPAIFPLLYTGFSRRSLIFFIELVNGKCPPLHNIEDGLFSKLRALTFPLTRHIYGEAAGAEQGAEAILEYFAAYAAFSASMGSRPESSSALWEPPHKTWLRSHKSGTRVAIGSPMLARVFHDRCIASMLAGCPSAPGRSWAKKYLVRTANALPAVYTRPAPENSLPQEANGLKYPAYSVEGFFSLYDYHLLKALIWLLPRAGFSDKLLHHSNRLIPRWTYLRWPKLSQCLRRSLDDYRVRVTNERIQELSKRIFAGDRDALIEKTRLLEVDALD